MKSTNSVRRLDKRKQTQFEVVKAHTDVEKQVGSYLLKWWNDRSNFVHVFKLSTKYTNNNNYNASKISML